MILQIKLGLPPLQYHNKSSIIYLLRTIYKITNNILVDFLVDECGSQEHFFA